jgi:hypothetical protein
MSRSQGIEVRRVSRRTIAKGAAWSVPVVAVGAAAPFAAASPTNCVPEFQVNPNGSFKCCNGSIKNMKLRIDLVDANNCLNPTDQVCVLDVQLANKQPIGAVVFVPGGGQACVTEGSSTFDVYLLNTQSCTVNLVIIYSVNGGPSQVVALKSDNLPGGNVGDGTDGQCSVPTP